MNQDNIINSIQRDAEMFTAFTKALGLRPFSELVGKPEEVDNHDCGLVPNTGEGACDHPSHKERPEPEPSEESDLPF